ncbi:MAG TPA: N-acetylmuramoyl-L-alanine amidase [Mycobacteriales bacterium]|nr:N-acetylmuramoyl-L-alanine amidase [Mycobacteriales bacterium]
MFLVVPVLDNPVVRPHPVAAHVTRLAVPATSAAVAGAAVRDRRGGHSSAPSAPSASGRHVLAQVVQPHTHRFELVGATWRTGSLDPGAAAVQVRVHRAGGWTGWSGLAPQDGGADGGSIDAQRAAAVHRVTQAAEPVWVGAADGVEARVVGAGAVVRPPSDLKVVLVDGGSSHADSSAGASPVLGGSVAAAATPRPQIYTRADWGADESLRTRACPSGPDYSPTIQMGFIHHTDGGNGYSRSQVPSIIRSIYAYHVQSNGWCDIGYNYLVDRFGRIWEGRYGGITKAVIGAHTGGFNTDTFGVALIGTFSTVTPPTAMTDAVEQLFAWRLGRYYRDPLGRATLTAASFSGSRYPAGSDVTFSSVSGHRDADFTDCPGADAYAELPDIRTGIAAAMGAGFVGPSVSATSVPMAAGAVTVRAGVISDQSWQLTVSNSTGQVVQTYTGTAGRSTPVQASWNLTGADGTPAVPGAYRLRLTGTSTSGQAARPWTTTVTVQPPVVLRVPAQVGLGTSVTAGGTGVPGHSVNVSVTSPQGPQPVGTATVTRSGTWSLAASVTADRDLQWTATDSSASGYQQTSSTRVGPVVSAPAAATTFVERGSTVTLTGSALPGTGNVTVMTQPDGATAATAGPSAAVGSDGSWSASIAPTTQTTVWVVDSRGLASARKVVDPLSSPTAAAPASGYAGRTVTVRGDAGGPVPVTLLSRPSGGRWAVVRRVTAAADGVFRARLPLPTSGSSLGWKVRTGYGSPATGTVAVQPTFAPTASGPRRVAWNSTRELTGSAVPGDTVTVSTAAVGSSRWRVIARVRAAADKTWTVPVRFTTDTRWRVSAPTGTAPTGTTIISPTIHAPRHVAAGGRVVLHGTAVPGSTVALYHRTRSGAWRLQKSVAAAGDGSWQVVRHPRRSTDYRVVSNRHWSRTITVAVP